EQWRTEPRGLLFGSLAVVRWRRADRRLRRDRRVYVAENDRQAILAAADDHDLGVRRLRKLKRRFDAAPADIRIRNALGHGLLEVPNAVGFDLLALRLFLFAFDAETV